MCLSMDARLSCVPSSPAECCYGSVVHSGHPGPERAAQPAESSQLPNALSTSTTSAAEPAAFAAITRGESQSRDAQEA